MDGKIVAVGTKERRKEAVKLRGGAAAGFQLQRMSRIEGALFLSKLA